MVFDEIFSRTQYKQLYTTMNN